MCSAWVVNYSRGFECCAMLSGNSPLLLSFLSSFYFHFPFHHLLWCIPMLLGCSQGCIDIVQGKHCLDDTHTHTFGKRNSCLKSQCLVAYALSLSFSGTDNCEELQGNSFFQALGRILWGGFGILQRRAKGCAIQSSTFNVALSISCQSDLQNYLEMIEPRRYFLCKTVYSRQSNRTLMSSVPRHQP